ncbi:hypothetical protein PV328_010418 [Microctonus aethiopoides]|uniref:SNRNP25 ubiquitin-like domain-containing protein n=1 Tax=Microctonus aethiopoides TaxID=144406 RepID=A0AA39FHN0_9HYME|nr:hypothetical protein PV328_010418 [Microctonus aethiopoides]
MMPLSENLVNDAQKLEYQLSHEELMEFTRGVLNKIIDSDPLFSEVPSDATVEEIKAQTAVAQGQAITLNLNRRELSKLAIVVPSINTTVLELKNAIQIQTNLALHREKIKKKISWKHVWKKYHLSCYGVVLNDEKEKIKNYGVINKTELNYLKKRREKNRVIKLI